MRDLIDPTIYNSLSERERALCEREANALAACRLTECYFVLAEAVRRFKQEGIAHVMIGAINTSYLAYVAGIIPYKPVTSDYVFEQFINPERETALPPKMTVVIDVADSKMLPTRKYLMIAHKPYEEMVDLLITGTPTLFESRYSKVKAAKSAGKSILEVSVNLRPEIAGYAELLSHADPAVTVTDAALYDHVNSALLTEVFGYGAQLYLGMIRNFEPRDLDGLALCMAAALNIDKQAAVRAIKSDGSKRYRDEIHELLSDSRGVFTYDEQAIKALSALSGCSYAFADNARRAMSMFHKINTDSFKQIFLYGGDDGYGHTVDGCAARGTLADGRELWAELEQIAPGLYCKANAVRRARFYLDCARLALQCKK